MGCPAIQDPRSASATDNATLVLSDGKTEGTENYDYDYGVVIAGNSKDARITISNTGIVKATDLTVGALPDVLSYVGGIFPGTGGNCGAVLNPGDSCILNIKFTPNEETVLDDTISISYYSSFDKVKTLYAFLKLKGTDDKLTAPEITSISPTIGNISGGTIVSISGPHFYANSVVKIGGSSCTGVTRLNSKTLLCTTSAHAAGTVDVQVTSPYGYTGTLASSYRYNSTPAISSVSPSGGPPNATTNISITGTSFTAGATVLVGSGTCTGVTVVSSTQITCTVPAQAAGSYDVTVTNTGGFTSTLSSGFTYRDAPTVSSVAPSRIYTAGRQITITGTGFVTGATVTVNGSSCSSVSVNSSTSLTCIVGSSTVGTYGIVVTNTDTQYGSLSNALTVASTGVWLPMSTTNAPSPRLPSSVVWTGSQMIIWSDGSAVGNGKLYDPVADNWTTVSTTNRPQSTYGGESTVWTGSKMIVWGGYGGTNSGSRYDPVSNTWSSMTTTGAPSARFAASTIWTGGEMVLWGGRYNLTTNYFNDGGKYNPYSDSWAAISTTNAPQEAVGAGGVWSGSELLVWGGQNTTGNLNTGGRYNVNSDSWTLMTTTNAPTRRATFGMQWTGSKAIVMAGFATGTNDTNSGGIYDPETNSWTATTTTGAPRYRYEYASAWTGSSYIVWGGITLGSGASNLNTGGLYNPVSNSWVELTSIGAAPGDPGLRGTVGVWTGRSFIVFGGRDYNGTAYTNTGGQYIPPADSASNSWTLMTTSSAPRGGSGHVQVWTGSKMLVWGTNLLGGTVNTGGSYDTVTNSWTALTTTNAPPNRSSPQGAWTGSRMIVYGGTSNTGGSYDPVSNSWTTLSTTNAPAARTQFLGFWTGRKMIFWGGISSVGSVDMYDPATNSWTSVSTSNAPPCYYAHPGVWTGKHLLVWGTSTASNQGGAFNPETNVWTTITTTNAPSVRLYASAVWTGSKMLVWGGDNSGALNSGGAYDVISNSWTALSTTSAPVGRTGHTAIWTGSKMIVWGGSAPSDSNTGALYDPYTNTWSATTTIGVPPKRSSHRAIWTGNKMLIWGSNWSGGVNENTGGVYTP